MNGETGPPRLPRFAAHLKRLVKAIFDHSDHTYGYRRVHAQLVRQGEQVSPELVRELMRDLNLIARQPRPWHEAVRVVPCEAQILNQPRNDGMGVFVVAVDQVGGGRAR